VFIVFLLSYIYFRSSAAAALIVLGRDVRQMIDTAHDGDNVTHGHDHVHLTENSVHSHVMPALEQPAKVAVAHFLAQARRLLNGCLGGDEPQH